MEELLNCCWFSADIMIHSYNLGHTTHFWMLHRCCVTDASKELLNCCCSFADMMVYSNTHSY
jgi:hypothetical protein